MPVSARDLILRKLAAANAQVELCEELLTDLEGEEEVKLDVELVVVDDPPAKAKPKKKPGPKPVEPSATEHAPSGKSREKLVKIAKALAERPRGSAELVEATGIPKGSMTGVIARGLTGKWWAKTGSERGAPYELTEEGRRELLGE